MKTISNEEKARHIVDVIFERSDNKSFYEMAVKSAMQAMKWKDEQHEQEKQQIIDKAMKVICNGCAQKVECEFKNRKTCTTRDELIKSIE